MIGLIALAIFAVWLSLTKWLTLRFLDWYGVERFRGLIACLVFVFIFFFPFLDHLIGRWQFKRLCDREAVVTLSPNWREVKRVKEVFEGPIYLKGKFIKIKEYRLRYIDMDTGNDVLLSKGFITKGGILFDRFGLGLGGSTSCRPPNEHEIFKMINIDKLVEQGKEN